ncbi:MAG: riboflavin biosynthesis protein RibF [Verrucomicrobia bacterium CG_4_10_14_3_um_filter_43_23]|nr:MAG: riboflavin biosynthesis protein RibF [Verrucomicrobia bacterium CG1_02_43_26]PIX57670.1 MAG: riboflavin biosynthesis protein RibF [Verrucomicrobia bacterium CG_4_10_14_3_um_filter_43_23]PIY61805.1 MAG: riboflavin biosynthesis protein RibF [Verrucomicrobia bacterium CG_4_10_14_0_8_um_filter_43_34]PJA44754.1 MAG: riboflavin biosynthesis protein RibF [Verrucomicrobia bacterium CG_4_9_14_3_um_filter_43_20]
MSKEEEAILAQLGNRPIHLAIGIFDGVHNGHQNIIWRALEDSRSDQGITAVMTFSPHPSRVIPGRAPTPLIYPTEVNEELMRANGAELIIQQTFSKEFSDMPAEEFVTYLINSPLLKHLKYIYVGEGFKFGHHRKGDTEMLSNLALEQGVKVIVCPKVEVNGQVASSTLIREKLKEGKLEEANELLGYTYFSIGEVVEGKHRGTEELDTPTLNIHWEPELQPKYGVYVVQIEVEREDGIHAFAGVANYGVRPTFHEHEKMPTLEVHCLSPNDITYDDVVYVRWHKFLRPEKEFDSPEALKKQIQLDIKAAIAHFSDDPNFSVE